MVSLKTWKRKKMVKGMTGDGATKGK